MENPVLECKTVIVCEKTSVDAQTKMLSFINIIRRLFITLTPEEVATMGTTVKQVQLPMELIVVWERQEKGDEEAHTLFKVHLVDPDGEVLLDDIAAEAHLQSGERKFYSIVKLDGMPCAKSGVHTFKIVHTDIESGISKIMYEEPLEVVMADQNGDPVTARSS